MTKRLVFLFCLMSFPVAAGQLDLRLNARDCQKIVPADYVVGVSVTGQSVVPADLSPTVAVPDLSEVTFPVTLDLQKDFSPWASELDMGTLPVAKVEMKDGRIYLNGALVSESNLQALRQACDKAGK